MQTEVAPAEAVQAKSVQPQVAQPQAAKTAEATEAVKPAASAQPASSKVSAGSAATQSSSLVRHMPRKPVVHKASAQHGTDSSASKSAAGGSFFGAVFEGFGAFGADDRSYRV